MNAFNSAYLLTAETTSSLCSNVAKGVENQASRSFWARVKHVLSMAGTAALLVG